jgi:hypothetical protein
MSLEMSSISALTSGLSSRSPISIGLGSSRVSLVISAVSVSSGMRETVIEHLFASDLAFLQDLYRRVNQEGHAKAAVECPGCGKEFTVDLTGGRLGES